MKSTLLTSEVSGHSPATQAGPRRCVHLCSVMSNMDTVLCLHWGEVENAKFTRSIWHSKHWLSLTTRRRREDSGERRSEPLLAGWPCLPKAWFRC